MSSRQRAPSPSNPGRRWPPSRNAVDLSHNRRFKRPAPFRRKPEPGFYTVFRPPAFAGGDVKSATLSPNRDCPAPFGSLRIRLEAVLRAGKAQVHIRDPARPPARKGTPGIAVIVRPSGRRRHAFTTGCLKAGGNSTLSSIRRHPGAGIEGRFFVASSRKPSGGTPRHEKTRQLRNVRGRPLYRSGME